MNRFVLFLLCWGTSYLWAERSLIVKPLSGTEQFEQMSKIGYVKIGSDSLFVHSSQGVLLWKNAISDIQHLRYEPYNEETPTLEPREMLQRNKINSNVRINDEHLSAIEKIKSNVSLRIYPNPTSDQLIIENANCKMVYLFDVVGHLLNTFSVSNQITFIDVSFLPYGEYLLYLNSQIVKFIKK